MKTARAPQNTAADPLPATRRAWVQDSYGSADNLKLINLPVPAVGDNDVLIRVRATGLDRGVWHLMTGRPYLMRIMGLGFRRPKVRVPGMDVAGIVEAVGRNVTRFKQGDEVLGTSMSMGAWAEYASAPADKFVHMPANLTFEQAAALPVSALAALKGVRDVAKVKQGQTVLVIGAGGGVGSYAVQLAKLAGAEVTGVCSAAKAATVLAAGADHVIDYTREDITRGGLRYDVILDIAGNRTLSHLRRALAPRGTLVIVGGEAAGKWFGGIDRQLRAMLLSVFSRQRLASFVSLENPADMKFLQELAAAGKLVPLVDRAFSFEQAGEAMRHLEEGKAKGKIVITM